MSKQTNTSAYNLYIYYLILSHIIFIFCLSPHRSFSDTGYFTTDTVINICTMHNGKYEGNCVKEVPIVSTPAYVTPSEAELLFAKFDTNRDGFVSRYELQMGLENELEVRCLFHNDAYCFCNSSLFVSNFYLNLYPN